MNNETLTALENLLFDYCCAVYTSKQVQRKLAKLGYKADLKGDSYIIDVMHVESGEWFPITT